MVMQYYVRTATGNERDVAEYGTLVWNPDRRPVELEIDPHWQLAGAHRDGRAVFVNTQQNSEGVWGYQINIVRIEP
jgi:hypothetical protein